MQGSKIKPHEIYAIFDEGKLVRFRVKAIVTRRVNSYGNPHDYDTTVEGFIVENNDNKIITVAAEKVLGPYQEQAELLERKRQEDLANKRANEDAEHARNTLRDLLYTKTGLPIPDDDGDVSQPFRTSFSSVEIRQSAILPLIEYLKRH